jgi:hypothetical protein
VPEESEIETKELEETITELREERAERQREEKETSWTRWISLSTALLAVVAAVAALQSGTLVNEALLAKNNAVLKQSLASDQWAFYQAKGLKALQAKQSADILAALPNAPAAAEKWAKEAERYKEEQKEIETKAHDLESERDADTAESHHLMHRHHAFAYCVTFTQVAIALSAIAALTKRKPLWYLSLLTGVAGVGIFSWGLWSTFTMH